MSTQRIPALEYIRGISMLGVIGIHTGAYSLSNPHVNIHLFGLLEIASRFSVPIFFFVSAFGLFLHQKDLTAPLNYTAFMKKRLKTVGIPYLIWSLLYLVYISVISHNLAVWSIPVLLKYLFFGLASYQLYFLVLLLWFYALMPLWRILLRYILKNPLTNLLIALALQILFNYYSSYLLVPPPAGTLFHDLVDYRMNYWIAHYFFIFILGAVCALRFDSFKTILTYQRRYVTAFFAITLGAIMLYYYYLLFAKGYTPEEAVCTNHQLGPIGVLYTVSSTFFWFMIFSKEHWPAAISTLLNSLGKHSYFIYLVHPFVMYCLSYYMNHAGYLFTAKATILFYLATLLFSLLLSLATQRLSTHLPWLGRLLTGSIPSPRVKKAPTTAIG